MDAFKGKNEVKFNPIFQVKILRFDVQQELQKTTTAAAVTKTESC